MCAFYSLSAYPCLSCALTRTQAGALSDSGGTDSSQTLLHASCVRMYVWVYLCMYACMHVCMYACMYVCIVTCMYVCNFTCMHACMHACMYVCMYECSVCVCVCVWKDIICRSNSTYYTAEGICAAARGAGGRKRWTLLCTSVLCVCVCVCVCDCPAGLVCRQRAGMSVCVSGAPSTR